MSDFDFSDSNDNEFFVDLSDAEETTTSSPVAPGKYTCTISKVEQKKTKAGDPAMNITLDVQLGDDKVRKVFDYILLDHANENARKIGRARAKALFLAALGTPKGNMLHLVGVDVIAKITVDKNNTDKNNVQDYYPVASDKTPKAPMGGSDVAPF